MNIQNFLDKLFTFSKFIRYIKDIKLRAGMIGSIHCENVGRRTVINNRGICIVKRFFIVNNKEVRIKDDFPFI